MLEIGRRFAGRSVVRSADGEFFVGLPLTGDRQNLGAIQNLFRLAFMATQTNVVLSVRRFRQNALVYSRSATPPA
jgi:hypothetical protein